MVIDYKNFDDKIREAFDDFEVRPPAHVWYGVAAGMSAPQKKRIVPVYLRVAAAVAVLMVTSISLWFLTFQPLEMSPRELASLPPLEENLAGRMVQADPSPLSTAPSGLLTHETERDNSAWSLAEDEFDLPSDPDFKGLHSLLASLTQDLPGLMMPVESTASDIALFDGIGDELPLVDEGIDLSFLSLGMHVSPQYSYRHIINPTETNKAGIPFEQLENPLFSYNMGFSVQAKVLPWLSLRTGLNYGTMGQFVSDIIAFSHPENLPMFEMDKTSRFSHPQTIVTSQGNIRLSEPTLFFADSESYRVITNKQFDFDGGPEMLKIRDFGISQYFTFLEIPVTGHFKVVQIRETEILVKAGGSLNYILGNEVFLGHKTMLKPIGETYGLRKFNFSAQGGIVVNVPIGEHFKLTFEPTGQVYLLPMVRDQLMIGRALPFQYSLFTGISYGF